MLDRMSSYFLVRQTQSEQLFLFVVPSAEVTSDPVCSPALIQIPQDRKKRELPCQDQGLLKVLASTGCIDQNMLMMSKTLCTHKQVHDQTCPWRWHLSGACRRPDARRSVGDTLHMQLLRRAQTLLRRVLGAYVVMIRL